MRRGPGGTFIKICGVTTAADARLAVEAGADAVGLIFAPSPRRVTHRTAAAISAGIVNAPVERIGVFTGARQDQIARAIAVGGLTGVQIHGLVSRQVVQRLKQLKQGLRVIQVVRLDALTSGLVLASELAGWLQTRGADAVMIDSKDLRSPGRRSKPVPIEMLAQLSVEGHIVAGGLEPATVGRIVRSLRPLGVDVSGGVEASPGRKDPAKVAAFVRAVRSAERAR